MNKKVLDHKCPACRAVIKWNPNLKKFKCEYCDSQFTLKQMEKFDNASNAKNNEGKKGEDIEYDQYSCKNCGAEIIADAETTATFCVYCGNTAIIKNKLSGKFAPDFIIPFKKTKEEAIEKFINLKKGRPLMPKNFNNKNNIEKIRGIYIPFWLFDVNISGSIDYVCKKISTWSTSDYNYTKTDVYDVTREGEFNYSKIPIDGSTHFDNNIMSSLEPFDYKELEEYNHAYLSGFLAEKYNVDDKNSYKDIEMRAIENVKQKFKETTIGYTTSVIKNENLTGKINHTSYALLPVYMVNVKYGDKTYIFAMNGQTGEFIGDIPIDYVKTTIFGILSLIIAFLISFLVCYIIFIGGN